MTNTEPTHRLTAAQLAQAELEGLDPNTFDPTVPEDAAIRGRGPTARAAALIALLQPNTNTLSDIDRALVQARGTLGTPDLRDLERATMSMGRYGARVRNLIRANYPWWTE